MCILAGRPSTRRNAGMQKFKFLLAFVLLGWGVVATAQTTALRAANPIIAGFNPDPSICRVGDDFYLVTSTFEYFPGVPVYHSKDLVNWSLIGHALHRPEALNLDGIECSGGIYAPTLRHHDGVFYMITTLIGAKGRPGGNFIVTARNPAGPWSDPVWIADAPGIDPSLFFDHDGRLYHCGNGRPEKLVHEKHRHIWIQELDRGTLQPTGPRAILDSAEFFADGRLGPVNNFEAPHLYRRGDHYYLIVSHGGTGTNHAVSVWRSRHPLGPWEINPANPILTHRDAGDSPAGITCTGHADFTDAPDGSWWAVLLAVRSDYRNSAMGRETFLVPMSWEDGWPVINAAERRGRVGPTVGAPSFARSVPPPAGSVIFRDEFGGAALGLDWTFIRTPRTSWWRLADGALQVDLRPEQITELAQPSFAGIRITAPRVEVSARLKFSPRGAGEGAGIAVLRAREAAWTLLVEQVDGARVVTAYFGTEKLGSAAVAPEGPVDLGARLVDKEIVLRVRQPDGAWRELSRSDATPLFDAHGGRFTGAFAGLYATSRGTATSNRAEFDWFEMTPLP